MLTHSKILPWFRCTDAFINAGYIHRLIIIASKDHYFCIERIEGEWGFAFYSSHVIGGSWENWFHFSYVIKSEFQRNFFLSVSLSPDEAGKKRKLPCQAKKTLHPLKSSLSPWQGPSSSRPAIWWVKRFGRGFVDFPPWFTQPKGPSIYEILGFFNPSPPCPHLGLIYSTKFTQPPLLHLLLG